MANYLMKYKGTYRLLPSLDVQTNDFVRDKDGNIDDTDIYISCQYGNKIFTYGSTEENKKLVWLIAYIPSLIRGKNIRKALEKQGVEISNYRETDEEVEFRFKAKDIEPVAELMKVKTSGASISPFSTKNLPKEKGTKLPEEEVEKYKKVSSNVQKSDLLIIHRITTKFLEDVLTAECKKKSKDFEYKSDMKKLCMSRQVKEYIYSKNLFDEYLEYLEDEIKKYYN